jgi:membrane-associated phospholipid phosphatase
MLRPLLTVLLACLPAFACAEEELRALPRDLVHGLRQEARPEGVTAVLAGAMAAGAVRFNGTPFNDEHIRDTLVLNQPTGRRAQDLGAFIGNPLFLFPATGLAYAGGRLGGSDSFREFGLAGFEALILSGAETEVLKLTVRRLRPDRTDLDAFPSGHTSGSFALATVAASRWGWPAAVPAYLTAGFVGYSRIEKNKHYLSDVLFGAGLGIACGRSIHKARRAAEPGRYAWRPYFSPAGAGLEVVF